MSMKPILLCTDMDRTVIPNGSVPENTLAKEAFKQFCQRPQVTLAYVTGRHLSLALSALEKYDLPEPDYFITDVGSGLYHKHNGDWALDKAWHADISPSWRGQTANDLADIFHDFSQLSLQEAEKQNTYKLSYYLPADENPDALLEEMAVILLNHHIQASLIWSLDETKQMGLLDILPEKATKKHAIEFLQKTTHFADSRVIFAGDSGNDLPVLESSIQSILVANATEELKTQATQLAKQNNTSKQLYIAQSTFDNNGYYRAGVLQGVLHYAPEFKPYVPQAIAQSTEIYV